MISLVGNLSLSISLLFALYSIIARKERRIIAFYVASILPIIALFLLIYAFMISDFSIKNVFFNSSTLLPPIYKLSACWASHEGSILLWFALLSTASLSYITLARICFKLSENSQDIAISTFAFIYILFESFIIFTSSPFDPLSFQPKEGLGLNPMLQDVALAIHPPLIYAGLVSYVGIFAGGVSLLFSPREDSFEKEKILILNTIFSNFALAALTAGIGLGAWWAYRELGWGGYWFFDPVENISLLPWISGIALHHFILISRNNILKRAQYLSWTIALSLSCFLLVIYGTFIVRSGIISSIHAFAFSPERGLYIFAICSLLTLLSIIIFFWKQKNIISLGLDGNQDIHSENSLQNKAILMGNILWLISLFALIISLIYPIYCSLIHDVDVAIDPEYFKQIYIPIHIPILILAAFAPIFNKNLYKEKRAYMHILFALFLALLALGIGFALKSFLHLSFMATLFVSSAILLMLQTLNYMLIHSHYFTQQLSAKKYAFFLGHFGFALLVLSITLNVSLSQEIEFIGKVGKKLEHNGIKLKLENVKFADGENYFRQIAEFSIEDRDGKITILKPENRLYKIENSLSQEVDIYSYLFCDVYAVLSQINKQQIVHAKIYYQPFISFIWLAIFLISCGFLRRHSLYFRSDQV